VRGVFSDLLTIGEVRPDLVVIVLVYWGLAAGPAGGTLGGFVAGLVVDVDQGRALGLHAGLLCLVGFLVGQAGRRLIRENPFLQGALVGVAALVVGAGRALVVLAGQGGGAFFATLPLILGAAAYSAVLAPLLYWVVRRLGFPDPLADVSSEQ
jgi:rod shape-determining protein MreD